MKKLLSLLAVSTFVGTSASNLKPLFINNFVNTGFKSNQVNKDICIQSKNSGDPFINKIKTIEDDASVSSTAISSDGMIYVGTYNHGLYKSVDGIKFESVGGIPNDVSGITTLGKIVYVGTQKHGLWKSDNGIVFTKTTFIGSYTSTIAITPNGTIYVDYLGDLYKSVDGIKFDHVEKFNGAIYSIKINKGNIWVGTTEGLYKSANGNDFEIITNGISKDFDIRVVNIDDKNIIWVGTKQGLYKSIDGIKFESVDLEAGIKNEIRSIATNSKCILLGLDNGIIYKSIDGIKFEKIKEIYAYIQVNVTFDGTIYVGTEKHGLWIINSLLKINNFEYFGDKYDGSVYNSVQKIDIKENLVTSATLDRNSITVPSTDVNISVGEHTLILTLKDKVLAKVFGGDPNTGQVTYKLWVKTSVDKSKISYETNQDTDLLSGLVSDLGNTNGCDIIQTKAKTGTHNATLKTLFNSKMLDEQKSFYVQGTVDVTTNDFTETGTHQFLDLTKTEVNVDGIYKMHLVDVVGNVYDCYYELGQSHWKLKGTFSDDELNKLSTKLNVTVNLTDPTQKQEANGWLQKYQSVAASTFNSTVLSKGKGFNIIENDLLNGYKEFLEPVTYVNPQTRYAINQNKLDNVVIKIAEQKLKDGLSVLPQNLNVNTSNVVNKSTLDNYSAWIKNYQDFINKNKDKWNWKNSFSWFCNWWARK